MKCQHCGNHEANYHYRSNINGAVTDLHLCQACAREIGGVFAGAGLSRSMEAIFGGNFFSRPLGASMPLTIGTAVQAPPRTQTEPGEANIPAEADESLRRRRELNQIRGEMEAAVKADNFERAAELRDEIYRLEKERM